MSVNNNDTRRQYLALRSTDVAENERQQAVEDGRSSSVVIVYQCVFKLDGTIYDKLARARREQVSDVSPWSINETVW